MIPVINCKKPLRKRKYVKGTEKRAAGWCEADGEIG